MAGDLGGVGDHPADQLATEGDSSDCRIASSASSVAASLGAFWWVSTASTPGSAVAARVSMLVMRPVAMVACSGYR
jgi:hypothetical protein